VECLYTMDPSLDFASLLGIAEHVSKDQATTKVQLMKTKFDGPKKEKREKGKLSVNVAKFLQRKEADEREKKAEKARQLKNLQELRSDSAKNKIAKHLKVTKSANKAVISEAINKRDTADTLSGQRKQCDEDDYGFVSDRSNSIYEKLMGKYESCPEDPMAKFSKPKPKTHVDMQSAKERVKQALKKEEEPAPRSRKRRHNQPEPDEEGISYKRESNSSNSSATKHSSSSTTKDIFGGEKKVEEKSKRERDREREEAISRRKEMAKKAPKPMDFQSLLQVANSVKSQPIKVNKPKSEIKEAEFGGRPMTKKQREEYIRENKSRLRREGKLPKEESDTPPAKRPTNSVSSGSTASGSDKRDKPKSLAASDDVKQPTSAKPPVRRPEPGPELHTAVKKSLPPPSSSSATKKMSSSSRPPAQSEETLRLQEEYKRMQDKCREMEERLKIQEEHRALQEKMKEMKAKMAKMTASSSTSSSSSSKYSPPRSSSSSASSSNRKSSDSRTADRKRDIKDVPTRKFPGEKVAKKPKVKDKSRRQRIESDSEYDSEMDDFIDDSEGKVDISEEIRSIFGYDRNKYRDEPDFDDRSMENNKYSSIMQEEVRSARIGRMEDLEDIRREREEEERKRKMRKSKGR